LRRAIGGGTDDETADLCKSWRVRPSVLIVDDHAAFRVAARAVLEADGYRIVGEAADGASALAAVRALHPDVVLLDVQLPDLNGFEVARQFDRGDGAPAVVFVSSRAVSALRQRLAANPAWRFIAKAELSAEALSSALT
jgi:DNA-binding NarL/FixJ family response regulator